MSSDQIQLSIRMVIEEIVNVPVGSGPDTALLYPLFHVGVVAKSPVLRNFILKRLSNMKTRGNAEKTAEVLYKLWTDGTSEDVRECMDCDELILN